MFQQQIYSWLFTIHVQKDIYLVWLIYIYCLIVLWWPYLVRDTCIVSGMRSTEVSHPLRPPMYHDMLVPLMFDVPYTVYIPRIFDIAPFSRHITSILYKRGPLILQIFDTPKNLRKKCSKCGFNCIPRTKYVRGILWFSRRYAASADTSSFSR